MVDDAPVYFLRHTIVVTAITGLHMKDCNAKTLGHD